MEQQPGQNRAGHNREGQDRDTSRRAFSGSATSPTGEGESPLAAADQPSCYETLDVDPGASRVEIREAYLRLKSTYGSGSAALYSLISEDEAREHMGRIEDAFRVLNDDSLRREYDRLRNQSSASRSGRAGGQVLENRETERLMLMRSTGAAIHGELNAQDGAPLDQSVIRTTRSTLPIIKLKANKAGGEDIVARLQEMLASSDPGDGDLFRRMREACDVSEDEMQERTKVSIGYIRAIETNRFDRLPQAVYVKGFLRSCCRYLGVPESEKLVNAFSQRLADWQNNKKS